MHGINNKWMYFLTGLVLASVLHSVDALATEGGMIPFDSPVGEIGGRGHWYALRTMKGEDYWTNPAVSSDIRENEDGTYSIAGDAVISLGLVLHPEWYPDDEPWRRAIDWIRQAEQMYRNSGVRVRFMIEKIVVWEDMPDTKLAAYNKLPSMAEYGADMTVGLMPHFSFDNICGVAAIGSTSYYGGSIRSVSGCNPATLAHELGHNFGLFHSFNWTEDNNPDGKTNKGYCLLGSDDAEFNCIEGTIMSYSRNRLPLFSTPEYTKGGLPLGDEASNAVAHLNQQVTGRALAWELDQQRGLSFSGRAYDHEEPAVCHEHHTGDHEASP